MIFQLARTSYSIRRSDDLLSVVGSQLIVTIPYISTTGEDRRRKIKIIGLTAAFMFVLGGGIIAVMFILPPLDVLFEKAVVKLMQ